MDWHTAAIWIISLASIALVLIRPRGLPEAWWATGGACLLIALRLIPPRSAAGAVAKGLDVYLFLTGMMIMSELARREGVFDWIAGHAVRASRGSRRRLFVLVYTVVFSIGIYYIRRLVLNGPKPAPVPEALPNRPLSLGAQE